MPPRQPPRPPPSLSLPPKVPRSSRTNPSVSFVQRRMSEDERSETMDMDEFLGHDEDGDDDRDAQHQEEEIPEEYVDQDQQQEQEYREDEEYHEQEQQHDEDHGHEQDEQQQHQQRSERKHGDEPYDIAAESLDRASPLPSQSTLDIPSSHPIHRSSSQPLPPPTTEKPITHSSSFDMAVSKVSGIIGDSMSRAADTISQKSDHMMKLLRGITKEEPHLDDIMLQSLNYDAHEDYVNELYLESDVVFSSINNKFLLFLKFAITILIAFTTSMLMYGVSNWVHLLSSNKIATTLRLIADHETFGAYASYVGASMALTCLGALGVSFLAPKAHGGGVPYVLAYLNGTNVSHYFTPRIVLVKAATLGFTIAGGLTLGMEGPFVYIGAGIGMVLLRGLDYMPMFDDKGKFTRVLRNIKEERIFMAGGMAAGLAVAFNAPIAGILMALEGSTAFLSLPTVLRIFGCGMFAIFFSDWSKNTFSYKIMSHDLIQITDEAHQLDYAWLLPEVAAFAVLGVIGGILGACATWINVQVTKWRHHHVEGVQKQVAEVAIMTFITTSCWFALPYICGCRSFDTSTWCTSQDVEERESEPRCRQVQCGTGEYSDIGSIVYNSGDGIAKLLFDRSISMSDDFRPFPLILYGVIYFILTSIVYGVAIPGGLFVPSILIGGSFGRVVGIFVRENISSLINPGVYSLLGAASMLGGLTRLALPVVIMLVEMTGDATYLLPIMFCTTVAKFVSDNLELPLYPQHMAIEGIPVLGEILKPEVKRVTASDVMLRSPSHVVQIMKLGELLQILEKSRNITFPVTTVSGTFAGMIMRRSIVYAINHTPHFKTVSDAARATKDKKIRQQYLMTEAEKRMTSWNDNTDYHQKLMNKFRNKKTSFGRLVNLTPFVDMGIVTCYPSTPTQRILALFRRVGQSHICVVDINHHLLGVITRRQLLTPPAPAEERPKIRTLKTQQTISLIRDSNAGELYESEVESEMDEKYHHIPQQSQSPSPSMSMSSHKQGKGHRRLSSGAIPAVR